MTTQTFVAITALLAGIAVLASPAVIRWAVGGWLLVAGVLWLVGAR